MCKLPWDSIDFILQKDAITIDISQSVTQLIFRL